MRIKQFLVTILVFMSIFGSTAHADCDFATGIRPNADGSYNYSHDCHLKVGQMSKDLDSANAQIVDYKKAIELKDLALTKSDERANLWMNTSLTLEKDLQEVDNLRSKNETLYYGLGVVTAVLAVFAAGQLRSR